MACISIWPNRIGRVLLDHNPSVEIEQMELGQALFLATAYGHDEVFQLLHDKGADLGFVVGDGVPNQPTSCYTYARQGIYKRQRISHQVGVRVGC